MQPFVSRASLTLLVVAALALPAPAAAQLFDPHANVRAQIDSALALAKEDHRLVLLDFGADWCAPCWQVERFFNDPSVRPFVDEHFHVVKVDVGEFNHNMDISRRYGSPTDRGVPAISILSPEGRMLANTRTGTFEGAQIIRPSDLLRYLQRWARLGERR